MSDHWNDSSCDCDRCKKKNAVEAERKTLDKSSDYYKLIEEDVIEPLQARVIADWCEERSLPAISQMWREEAQNIEDYRNGKEVLTECFGCREIVPCNFEEDPYNAEINEDYTLYWQCDECMRESRDNI